MRNFMEKILRISLKLNFTPSTLGCYGLTLVTWKTGSLIRFDADTGLSRSWRYLWSLKCFLWAWKESNYLRRFCKATKGPDSGGGRGNAAAAARRRAASLRWRLGAGVPPPAPPSPPPRPPPRPRAAPRSPGSIDTCGCFAACFAAVLAGRSSALGSWMAQPRTCCTCLTTLTPAPVAQQAYIFRRRLLTCKFFPLYDFLSLCCTFPRKVERGRRTKALMGRLIGLILFAARIKRYQAWLQSE